MNPENEGSKKEFAHPLLSQVPGARAKKGKVVSAEEAVRVIRDGDTVATGGFVGLFPDLSRGLNSEGAFHHAPEERKAI